MALIAVCAPATPDRTRGGLLCDPRHLVELGSFGVNRLEVLRSLFPREGRILEIGPLAAPIAPARDGYRVETVDHLSTEGLREKYEALRNKRVAPDAVDPHQIVDVDHVWDGRPLPELVTGPYDTIIASHVIEHIPDPLGFLIGCRSVLAEDGQVVLAIPDHRRCFDVLRPPSSLGEVLAAHAERRRRHPPAAVYDYHSYFATRKGAASWRTTSTGHLQLVEKRDVAVGLFEQALVTDDYMDVHGWVFSPASFRAIVESLWTDGILQLREDKLVPTEGNEFFVTLSPSGRGPGLTVPQLLMRAAAAEGELGSRLTPLLGLTRWARRELRYRLKSVVR